MGYQGIFSRIKLPDRDANQSLVKALITSGSTPAFTICFLGIHKDIIIHIFIFNLTAIMCNYTKVFIGFMFVIDSGHNLLEVGTEILNVLSELSGPGSLSWYIVTGPQLRHRGIAIQFPAGKENFSSASHPNRISPFLTGTESSSAAGTWSYIRVSSDLFFWVVPRRVNRKCRRFGNVDTFYS
jgi:hypothetical protein